MNSHAVSLPLQLRNFVQLHYVITKNCFNSSLYSQCGTSVTAKLQYLVLNPDKIHRAFGHIC